MTQGRRLATQMDEMCELLPKMIALRQHLGEIREICPTDDPVSSFVKTF